MKLRNSAVNLGFTLVEMAIVLLIISVLVGGILKGQAMINTARVHAFVSDLKSIQLAYQTFVSKYHHIPGDWSEASSAIPGAVNCEVDCNMGQIDSARKSIIAFNQMSAAGLLSGSYNGIGDVGSSENSPTNPWGGIMQIGVDNQFLNSSSASRMNLKTGGLIPAVILKDIDQTLDDGSAKSGGFRFSSWQNNLQKTAVEGCVETVQGHLQWSVNPDTTSSNCSGAYLFD
ncbi:prepilin-type N-terminal cleavage/methylation domain-containing protein [Leeia sp. TBRC 13508]|uniref:Prepilin-type N-terminal cleavage/methylation domain-containing protein n=1 Tax=Leeia speluncae TaxID=2884804 RepID=A0ABS8D6T1_9NEIS|nr:prepilin-type N-terminal cleavage/methylation domain-containing protein [Leeia speluncae]MCB6183686.1 prepilin-type N-terminal cleavage/methylation domain-containing protein [Leeia speluncae]